MMDVRDMKGVDDASVDVAFDKSTLDVMIHGSPWSPPQDVRDNTSAYLREVCHVFGLAARLCSLLLILTALVKVQRVLKDNGRFLCVTFRQPHFIKPLLNPEGLWNVEMQVLSDVGSFNYYSYVIRKAAVEKPGKTCHIQ